MRAQQILEVLEQHNLSVETDGVANKPQKANQKIPHAKRRITRSTLQSDSLQMALFTPKTHPLIEEIRQLELSQITPLDAVNILYDLKAKADDS